MHWRTRHELDVLRSSIENLAGDPIVDPFREIRIVRPAIGGDDVRSLDTVDIRFSPSQRQSRTSVAHACAPTLCANRFGRRESCPQRDGI
jgi:hypothetical protein